MSDRRAVSVTLSYVLALGITALLITGVMLAAGGLVQDQREHVVRNELEVLGQRLAADLAAADHLVSASAGSPPSATVRVQTHLPARAGGTSYRVEVETTGGTDTYVVRLTADDPSVSVTATVRSETTLAETSASGGDVLIVYESAELVIKDD